MLALKTSLKHNFLQCKISWLIIMKVTESQEISLEQRCALCIMSEAVLVGKKKKTQPHHAAHTHVHTTLFQYVTDGFFLRERNNHDNHDNNNNNNNDDEVEEENKMQCDCKSISKNHYLTHTKFF